MTITIASRKENRVPGKFTHAKFSGGSRKIKSRKIPGKISEKLRAGNKILGKFSENLKAEVKIMSGTIKSFIRNIDMYYMFHVFAFIALFIMNIIRAKKYNISKVKSIIGTILIYSVGYAWMLVLYWIESGFTSWGGQNIVRIFIWVPLIAWPVSKLIKTEWKTLSDFIAPCLCLNHGIAHFGCLIPGCCHGFPSSWGIYSRSARAVCFPVQIFEAVTALLITAYLLRYAKKKNYPTDGRTYAIMLMLFGSTRFIWEFFRDNNKLFWGISNLAIHALIMCIAGCLAYFRLIPYMEKKKNNSLKQTR